MPLISTRDVMRELGLRSRQSVLNLAKRGLLTKGGLPITGENPKRVRARFDSDQVAELKRRIMGGKIEPNDPSDSRSKPRTDGLDHRPRPSRRKRAKSAIHFE
jgi:hypothetical protein